MTDQAIVPAALADSEAIARLHARCFDEPWSAAAIGTMLDQPGAIGLLVRADKSLGAHGETSISGDVAAFILGRVVVDEAEILSLAVAPSARRQGHARRLVSDLAGRAREMGAAWLYLEVSAANAPAIALYERASFRRVGVRRGYYQHAGGAAEDALLLGRDLVGMAGVD